MNTLKNILTTLLITISILSPAEAQVKFSEKIGGSNGSNFMIPSSRSDILSTEQITGIAIQHSRRIEQIVVEYADDQDFRQVEFAGQDAGEWSYIELEEGEFITYITGRAGTLIDQLTFHTSMRRTFGPYGGSGGNDFEISIPSNAKVIGFSGQSGPSINQIGLIYKIAGKASRISNNKYKGTKYKGNDIARTDTKTRTVRDHRTNRIKKSSKNFQNLIGVVAYTQKPLAKAFSNNTFQNDSIGMMISTPHFTKDIKPSINKMNGRGTVGPVAKKSNTSTKRKVRDHRKKN